MDFKYILSKTDHTLLKPGSTEKEILNLIQEGLEYKVASICIPPSFVHFAHQTSKDINICTVVGFPNGYNTTSTKLKETEQALKGGASEIDMVINIGALKDKKYKLVEDEIREIKDITHNNILKVIIETCLLTEEEKITMCKIISDAGVDYIKTSTGFSIAGATVSDIELFKKHVDSKVKIKAAGGIRTLEDAKMYLDLGCDRIGASSIVAAVKHIAGIW
ncbi:MAG TPA: deoxyribose-phosphate aldolase [Clostridia bacterium]|mgnify:CR=1 FL=1|nr:deoxyribose-phosphate aldolase [Clostridia bacterium]